MRVQLPAGTRRRPSPRGPSTPSPRPANVPGRNGRTSVAPRSPTLQTPARKIRQTPNGIPEPPTRHNGRTACLTGSTSPRRLRRAHPGQAQAANPAQHHENRGRTPRRRNKGNKAATGLPQARLIVYCQLTTLLGLAEKAGITQHGLAVSPGDLRRELCNAGVIPIVFNGESQILDVGREQRFVPDYMRQAVLARDGGCIVPGCTVPPEHLEMCHIDSWADGGTTDIENWAPGCVNHHHGYHTGQYRLVRNDHGLPAVILPKYLDPEQKPRRNTQWQQHTQSGPHCSFKPGPE